MKYSSPTSKLLTKQKKKEEALNKKKNRERVSKYRFNKKNESSKLVQFYIDSPDKEILDKYKLIKGQNTSEVFKDLIRSILNRRLKQLE